MSSIDETTGARYARTVAIGGVEFRVGVASLRLLGMVRSFLADNPPDDPIESAREILALPGIDGDIKRDVIGRVLAERKAWPPDPTVNPGEAYGAMISIDRGAETLLDYILRDCRDRGGCSEAKLTDADCGRLANEADNEAFMEAIQASCRLENSMEVSRGRSEIGVMDSDGKRKLAVFLLAALEMDAEPDRVMAAADAIPFGAVGTAIVMNVANSGASVPKSEAPPARRRPVSSRSST